MPVFILLALMSVPLAWIASRTYLKARELAAGRESEIRIKLLEAELREMKKRVEVLETIAIHSSSDPAERVIVEPLPGLASPRAQAQALALRL